MHKKSASHRSYAPNLMPHTIQALPSLLFRSNHSFVEDEPQSGLLRFVNFEFPEWESFRFGSTFFLFPRQNEKVLRPCFFESYVTNFADEKISPHITPYLSIISIGPIFLFVEKFSLLFLFLLRSFLFFLRARTYYI